MKLSKKDQQLILQGSTIALLLLGVYVYFKTESLNYVFITVLGILAIVLAILIILRSIQKNRLKKSGITEIDKMDGFLFEEFLAVLFKEHGYHTKRTRSTGDFGADLTIKKEGKTTVVQAKRYNSNVGIKAIQEIVGSVKYYNADHAMVITNSYFTGPAIKLAKTNNVELIDRDKLINMLLEMNPGENKVSMDKIIPVCPTCDVEMVIRNSRHGKFYGCQNFPRCRKTLSMN